jgi:hypothetical protein
MRSKLLPTDEPLATYVMCSNTGANDQILKACTLSDDIKVQQDRYNALYKEAAEVARSMPKEHPCVAKVTIWLIGVDYYSSVPCRLIFLASLIILLQLALLPKQLAVDPVGSRDRAFELWDLDQLVSAVLYIIHRYDVALELFFPFERTPVIN